VGQAPAPVGFEDRVALVELVPVELGDQVALGPEAVDEDPVDEDVGPGLGEPVGADELEETPLQLRRGPRGLVFQLGPHGTKGRCPAATPAAGQEGI
jgi:hypothetical protein